MVTRSKFLWPGSERRDCIRDEGCTPVPGVVPGVRAGHSRRLRRAQMEGERVEKDSYHYHRKEPVAGRLSR